MAKKVLTEEQKKKRKDDILFNDGIWYAVQFLVIDEDEPTLARDLLKDVNMSKEEMRRCQKKSGFLDDIMREFIKSCK